MDHDIIDNEHVLLLLATYLAMKSTVTNGNLFIRHDKSGITFFGGTALFL